MSAPADIASQLLSEREIFLAFVRERVQDPELAADIVQDSFVKAMKSAGDLRDNESIVAWFYRILRRTIIDAYRRRDARRRALDAFETEAADTMTAEDERTLCGCSSLP